MSTPTRMTSTTPLQALYLLNDPFVHEQSRRIADRILSRTPDDADRVTFAYELLFARPASSEELEEAQKFVTAGKTLLQAAGIESEQIEAESWRAYVRALLRLNEFVYLD
jgi:hypothetical protein